MQQNDGLAAIGEAPPGSGFSGRYAVAVPLPRITAVSGRGGGCAACCNRRDRAILLALPPSPSRLRRLLEMERGVQQNDRTLGRRRRFGLGLAEPFEALLEMLPPAWDGQVQAHTFILPALPLHPIPLHPSPSHPSPSSIPLHLY